MSDKTVSLRDAGRGRAGRDPGRDIHVRIPFPADRARLWVPKRGGTPVPPTADGPYEIVFQSGVLRDMSRHATAEEAGSRFGFLLGRLHRCPDTGIHYAVVDQALAAGEEFAEEAPGAYLLRAWAEAQPEFRRHPGVLVGWYHSHRLLGLLLSEGDDDANRRYFSDPWQCCVLFVPDDARPLGSVFRPGLSQGASGPPDPATFWELPPEEESGSRRPALDWTNYESREAAREGGDGAPISESRAAPPHERRVPGDTATMRVGVVIPPESEDAPPIPPRHRVGFRAALLVLVALISLVVAALLLDSRSNAPPAIVRPVVQRVPVPSSSPELSRFREIGAEVRTAIDRYEVRAGDFDLGRIGCDLLTTGYGLVDESFIRLVAMHARLDADLAADVNQEFERLSEEVDDVNDHFDASGCPRPE